MCESIYSTLLIVDLIDNTHTQWKKEVARKRKRKREQNDTKKTSKWKLEHYKSFQKYVAFFYIGIPNE